MRCITGIRGVSLALVVSWFMSMYTFLVRFGDSTGTLPAGFKVDVVPGLCLDLDQEEFWIYGLDSYPVQGQHHLR